MNLTENPEIVTWPPMHYLFVEKTGPFQETAQPAWQQLHSLVVEIEKKNKILGYMSLYKIEPEMIYRAGVSIQEKPRDIPAGLKYVLFLGGKYFQFTLKGSYMQLPEACGRVFEIIDEKNMKLRDDFYIENYVNDPKRTEEENLITQILVPSA